MDIDILVHHKLTKKYRISIILVGKTKTGITLRGDSCSTKNAMIPKKIAALILIGIFFLLACKEEPIKRNTIVLEADQQVSMLGGSTFFDGLTEIVYRNGIIYMADNSPRIFRLDSGLKIVKQIYSIGKGPGEFTSISDIDYDKDSLYVFTRSQGKIIVYDSTSTFIRELSVKDIAGRDMTIKNNKIYLSTPFARRPITIFDIMGNKIKTFGQQTANQESYNVYRNERMLLINHDKLIAVSPSEPVIWIYDLDGKLISKKRIEHPLLKDRIDHIEEFHSKPSSNGGLALAFLFEDAVIFEDKLYLLALTTVEEETEHKFAFVLSFDIEENGKLTYLKEYKLFRPNRNNRLFGIDLGFIDKNNLIIYDLRSKNIYSFEDERI